MLEKKINELNELKNQATQLRKALKEVENKIDKTRVELKKINEEDAINGLANM